RQLLVAAAVAQEPEADAPQGLARPHPVGDVEHLSRGVPIRPGASLAPGNGRSEEHTSELQSRENLVCRLLLEKKNLFPNNIKKIEGSDALIEHRLGELGEISSAEKRVLGIFAITSSLWITQQAWNSYIFDKDV